MDSISLWNYEKSKARTDSGVPIAHPVSLPNQNFESGNLHGSVPLKKIAAVTSIMLLFSSLPAQQQTAGDKLDLTTLAQIKTEAYDHSQIMEALCYMSEVYGPRVNNSRNHRAAAEWAGVFTLSKGFDDECEV